MHLEKELSNLVLNIDGTDYTIPPYGYLLQDFESHKCAVAVSYVGILANQYVLGETFLRNFFVSFNYGNYTISLAQNVNAPKSFNISLAWWAILLIVLSCLLIVGLIGAVSYYFWSKSKSSNKL